MNKMPIPDHIAILTAQRDRAVQGFQLLNEINETLRGRILTLRGEQQLLLAELREAKARLLAADQQHANEPEPDDHNPNSAWAVARAGALSVCFIDPDQAIAPQASASAAQAMPASALRQGKQTIGLLW